MELRCRPNTGARALAYNSTGPLHVTLRVAGADYEILDTASGNLLASQPIAETSEVDITGIAHSVSTLTVDFSGGAIVVPINYNGGFGGDNTLVLAGGTFESTDYVSSGPHSGTITLGPTVINYSNLTPIVDNTAVANRVFTDPSTSGDIIDVTASTTTAGDTEISSAPGNPGIRKRHVRQPGRQPDHQRRPGDRDN